MCAIGKCLLTQPRFNTGMCEAYSYLSIKKIWYKYQKKNEKIKENWYLSGLNWTKCIS